MSKRNARECCLAKKTVARSIASLRPLPVVPPGLPGARLRLLHAAPRAVGRAVVAPRSSRGGIPARVQPSLRRRRRRVAATVRAPGGRRAPPPLFGTRGGRAGRAPPLSRLLLLARQRAAHGGHRDDALGAEARATPTPASFVAVAGDCNRSPPSCARVFVEALAESPGLRNARALAVIRGRNASFAAASSRARRRAASRSSVARVVATGTRLGEGPALAPAGALASGRPSCAGTSRRAGPGEGVASSAAPPRDRPDPGNAARARVVRLAAGHLGQPERIRVRRFRRRNRERRRRRTRRRRRRDSRHPAAAPASAAPASARAISRSCALGEYGETCDRAAARESASDAGALFVVGVPIGAGPPAAVPSVPAARTVASSFPSAKARPAVPLGAFPRLEGDFTAPELERARRRFRRGPAPGARRARTGRVAAAAEREKSVAGANVSSRDSSASRSRRACSRRDPPLGPRARCCRPRCASSPSHSR